MCITTLLSGESRFGDYDLHWRKATKIKSINSVQYFGRVSIKVKSGTLKLVILGGKKEPSNLEKLE